jgi:hypothetical protein
LLVLHIDLLVLLHRERERKKEEEDFAPPIYPVFCSVLCKTKLQKNVFCFIRIYLLYNFLTFHVMSHIA